MGLKGYVYRQIAEILSFSDSFFSKWWLVLEGEGVIGWRLSYQGSKGYLNARQRQAVINWLQPKNYGNLAQLQQHSQDIYSIKFQSRQSYDELFAQAGISWNKTQKSNPKKAPQLVKKTRNSCPTEPMVAGNSSRKNEWIFP